MSNTNSIDQDCVDPISAPEYPQLKQFKGSKPVLPSQWKCQALLHPFSPLQSNSTKADEESPFFEICQASIQYSEGHGLDAYLVGSSSREWWYKVRESGTEVSTDGIHFSPVDIGWSIPSNDWFGNKSSEATCAGTSVLNWMEIQEVDWWKIPVDSTSPAPATWMWFDNGTNVPRRLMFGQGPSSPTKGDLEQLALFQMFSFTYFTTFTDLTLEPINAPLSRPEIDGFNFGNPHEFDLFTWSSNFGMTAFMTPVNVAFNPLPTRVLYRWCDKEEYALSSDRSQSTLMKYTYNPKNLFDPQIALLTGAVPSGIMPPANSGAGFLINYKNEKVLECQGFGNFPFPQQAPTWVQTDGVEGTIQATIVDNQYLCPENVVTVVSVLFPPSGPNYPDSTYLWTWYSPLNSDGTRSRPVTFMQSQSGVNKGTSLALADYFAYKEFVEPIAACNFKVPPSNFTIDASKKWQKTGIVMNAHTTGTIRYADGVWTANSEDNDGVLYDANGNPTYINAKSGYTMPNKNEGALIGKVGETIFLIGNDSTIPLGVAGELELCINDDLNGEYGAGLTDNKGAVNVKISIKNVE